MNPKLETLFDEPDKRYLNVEELNLLSQYVGSLPERIKIYRQLRNEEIAIMQPIADELQRQMPQESEASIERSLRNALLALRYAAMAMLLDDQQFIQQRLEGWLPEIVKAHNTQAIEKVLYSLLNQQLAKVFTAQQLSLIQPVLQVAQRMVLPSSESTTSPASESLADIF